MFIVNSSLKLDFVRIFSALHAIVAMDIYFFVLFSSLLNLSLCFFQLVELWPKGFMDSHGIKRAISRAKDRKKAMNAGHKV